MANFYKNFDSSKDRVSTRTLLHEAIPLTGTIVSGTYSDNNIKNYAHGMFQSVYDYPYLSSSANHVFDITVGIGTRSNIYSATTSQQSKKKNIYNQMAQVCMGYDATGSILQFDQDGDLLAGGQKINDGFFMNFSRLLVKDEIKKGSFKLELGVDDAYASVTTKQFDNRLTITDASGSNSYLVNSPVGEYGILYATASVTPAAAVTAVDQSYAVGLIFYQAGVVFISGSVFNDANDGGILDNTLGSNWMNATSGPRAGFNWVTGSEVSGAADAIRNRIYNVQFNNTVELNSTIYFCRVNHNEFNYSANPTYLSSSKIRVKTQTTDVPVSYITSVGLYNDKNELMAVSKLSEPLKKTPDNEFTIRVRLDY